MKSTTGTACSAPPLYGSVTLILALSAIVSLLAYY